MQWIDIKSKSDKELHELLAEKRGELHALSVQAHARQLKQVHQIDEIKKTIARIATALRQRSAETRS